ncbi:probable beta-glucosidase [Phialocephala subalpina]|uniref:beta-glucosidase n=1 Tax=Phialocephala subalpina TaxID=576137 RepID=A0A1L7WBK8_9HELO|nr:probable beta-glucosidase [Phialocephala subalpina]
MMGLITYNLIKVNITTGVGWEGESCVGNTGSIPRLNFPGLCLQDSPLGVRDTDYNSAFPSGMNAAATWSTRLFKSRGNAMGAEHRGKGVDVQLGPVAGPIGRVPAGGRNWEGFSPDPVLTGVAMGETIQGIQDAGVIACGKHYIGNEQEHNREATSTVNFAYSANIDDKTMHELYLWPFADAVRAGVGSIMCSYNQINNSYGSQNSYTLNYLLKNELDFQGFVTSDWWAQHTGVASALAGLDMTMAGDQNLASGNTWWGSNLTAAVLNGTIPQWRLDDMVTRIMSAYYKVGRDTAKVPVNFNSWSLETYGYQHPEANEEYQQINYHVNVQDDHANLIREIGGASTVLLKNTNKALPLNKPKSIAVIGEDAHDNPGGPNACGDRGCDTGTLAMGWGSGTANFPYLIAPNTALKAQAASDGSKYVNVSNNYDFDAVTKAVTGADVAIVFGNADSGEGYITVDGNEGDRNNLTLWGNADALIAHVASIHPNTVVVLHTVGPVIVEAFKNHPNITALLWAGLPGQESGNAITDVLYGKVNPQAKSVFTWGKKREDWGVDVVYTPTSDPPQLSFNEGVFIDYRHFDAAGIEPSYEFGFGLSYTSFSYSNLVIQKNNPGPYEPTTGKTSAAPTFGTIDYNEADNEFPPGWHAVKNYVYPYLDGPVPTGQPQDWPAGATDGSPQPKLPAGGSGGGNRQLWDTMYTVSATVTNTGGVKGTEIPQLYISLGGPEDPKVVLRGFDDLILDAGESETFTYDITRRDISNWDSASQNWVVSSYPKTVYVGSSSRNLPLSGALS